ncbi:MAG TPA: trypsin-like serine protease [Clostridia bacterium]|nr:trypsin-like serine protease [Clostridia bacterium]
MVRKSVVAAILSLLLLVFLLEPCATASTGPNSVQFIVGQKVYVVDGLARVMDAAPFIKDGRTLVPVRFLATALGVPEAGILWDPQSQSVSLSTDEVRIRLAVGLKVMMVNDKPVELDVAPLIAGGRIYLPARYVAEALGYEVGWNEATQTVVVQSKAAEAPTPDDFTRLASRLQDYVVLVRVFDEGGEELGFGSGVVVKEDLVLTNLHVIEGGSRAVVEVASGKTCRVRGVVALDAENDLSLLKVEGTFNPSALGDSDLLKVGQKVVAVGNPLGLKATVSEGIVSGMRDLDGRRFIQTTAPISPGSSGGGLFDTEGNLVGITTACVEGGQNLNLAVPVNVAKALLQNIGPLAALPEAPEPERKTVLTSEDVVDLLNEECFGFEGKAGEVRFSYHLLGRPTGSFDIEVCGDIDPDTYLEWLLFEQDERESVVKQIANTVAEACGDMTFGVVLFYQDYWDTYPSSFDPEEVSLSLDGRSWLVTHVIASVFADEETVWWRAEP